MELNALIEQLLEIQKVHGNIPVISDEGYSLYEAYVTKPTNIFLSAKSWGFKESDVVVLLVFDN